MSKCKYCGKEWFTNMSKWMYEDVCKDCANKYIKVKERKTMKTSAYDLTFDKGDVKQRRLDKMYIEVCGQFKKGDVVKLVYPDGSLDGIDVATGSIGVVIDIPSKHTLEVEFTKESGFTNSLYLYDHEVALVKRKTEVYNMTKSAYDLTLKIISIMGDIDSLLDKKSKTSNIADRERLDKEIDRKEVELFDLKNILKKVEL